MKHFPKISAKNFGVAEEIIHRAYYALTLVSTHGSLK
jgi:hypothetical protein